MFYVTDLIKLFIPSLLTGILFILSIEPFDLWLFAYIAFIPLIYSSFHASYSRILALYISSALIISTGWWHSVISYSFLTYCLITFVLCISFAGWGVLSKILRERFPGPFVFIFVSTLIWVGIERIHTSELIGVPGNIGISQHSQPLLIQSSSLFGIYAVSFIVLLANTVIAYLLLMLNKHVSATRNNYIFIGLGVVIVASNIIYGYVVLQDKKSLEGLIKIAVVQPVIPSEVYQNSWRNPENRLFMKNIFDKLTSSAVKQEVDIIFWPEGGNGYLNMRIPELRQELYSISKNNNVNFLVSSDDMDETGKKYNSIFSISRQGELLGRYDKVKLIPDAESSYTPGDAYKPVNSLYGFVGAAICYETNFPSIFREMVNQGARILFASTSDAAFKRSSLILSHTNLSVFRAVENRRWMVHASNTGPSIIVSPSGEIIAGSSVYRRQILTSYINALDEKSVFVQYGYLIPEILAVSVLLLVLVSIYKLLIKNNISRIDYEGKTIIVHGINKLYLVLPGLMLLVMIHGVVLIWISATSVYMVNRLVDDNTSFYNAFDNYISLPNPQDDIISDRFLQTQNNTCGPAVLAYLLSYYGKELAESDLIPYMQLTDRGVSMLDLKHASNKFGFDAVGLKANIPGLENQVLPVIAYINNSHYVVINQITGDYIYMFDPIEGHVKVSRKDFRKMWNGYILLIKMKPILKNLNYNNKHQAL